MVDVLKVTMIRFHQLVNYKFTAEDSCPSYKPYKCKTGKCYYECERCNKYPDCFDGYDETGCMGKR